MVYCGIWQTIVWTKWLMCFPVSVSNGTLDHKPHSRQVTGARCTEVAARQSWAEYSSRPTTDSWIQGWAIKDFSVLNVMHCISKYTINGIFSMILNFNQLTILMKPKNLQLLYISILKNKKASGHSHILLTSVRACSSWLNSSWPGTHMLIRYGSMTPRGAHMRPLPSPLRAPLLLRKVVCNVHVALSNLTQHLFCIDIWWTRSPEYEAPVFNAQTHNHQRKWKDCASVPGNGLPICRD